MREMMLQLQAAFVPAPQAQPAPPAQPEVVPASTGLAQPTTTVSEPEPSQGTAVSFSQAEDDTYSVPSLPSLPSDGDQDGTSSTDGAEEIQEDDIVDTTEQWETDESDGSFATASHSRSASRRRFRQRPEKIAVEDAIDHFAPKPKSSLPENVFRKTMKSFEALNLGEPCEDLGPNTGFRVRYQDKLPRIREAFKAVFPPSLQIQAVEKSANEASESNISLTQMLGHLRPWIALAQASLTCLEEARRTGREDDLIAGIQVLLLQSEWLTTTYMEVNANRLLGKQAQSTLSSLAAQVHAPVTTQALQRAKELVELTQKKPEKSKFASSRKARKHVAKSTTTTTTHKEPEAPTAYHGRDDTRTATRQSSGKPAAGGASDKHKTGPAAEKPTYLAAAAKKL